LSIGVAACFLAACPEAVAQGARKPSVEDLQRQIEQRDAIINDLMRRVDALEHQNAQQQQPSPPPAAAVQPAPAPGAAGPPQRQAQREAAGQRPQVTPVSPGKGGVAAEEETLARALERSLVEQGGQLLPPFVYELVPQVIYSHQAQNGFTITNTGAFGPTRARRDILESDLIFRAGLPFDTQIDFTLPFTTEWRDATFFGRTQSRTDTGIGDVSVGLSKQVLYERGWVPDAIVNVRYQAATGSAHFNPGGQISGVGNGADSVLAGLTLIKRQDPLVFFGGPAYIHNFTATDGSIKFSPGDAIDFRAGTILAASPDTSLRFAFDTSFVEKNSTNGQANAGSDQVVGFFEIAASSILTERILLDFAFDIGVTRDAPDFRAILQLPIRF
jgi:hypothetical protein